MKTRTAILMAAASTLYMADAVAQNQRNTEAQGNACDRLGVFASEERHDLAQAERQRLIAVQQGADGQRCEAELTRLQTAANETGANETDGRIVIEQAAPAIRIDQAEPRVEVRQAQPDVAVTQPQPEILVRQPAPQVTVQIPQPEIIVRMPPPDVAVSQSAPEVQVSQPEPQVDVVRQQEQARVLVEQNSQPQVDVQRDQAEANVQVRRAGEPTVRYEAEDPQVRIERAEGQPTVRYEQAERDQAAAATPRRDEDAAGANRQVADRTPVAEDDGATGAVGSEATRAFSASDLNGMDLVNARGEQLGDVEAIVTSTADNRMMAVIAHGGFLGLGEKRVALPLENMALRDDRLVIRGVTEDQIKAMPSWRDGDVNYRAVQGDGRVDVQVGG